MKFTSSVLLVCLISVISTQAVDKSACLLGLKLTDEHIQQRALQQISATKGDVETSIANLMAWFPFLSQAAQDKLKACNLNLNGALARCEAANGANSCEKTATFAQKKCPEGLTRFGTRLCAPACPTGFGEFQTYCYKPVSTKSATFTTQALCETTTKQECEQWALEAEWFPKCHRGFRRIGQAQCLALCPEGTTDMGRMCEKKQFLTLGAPFTWKTADN